MEVGKFPGYNTASKEEKAKYNEKKLCRTMGFECVFIAIASIDCRGVFENILPAFLCILHWVLFLADVVIIIVLGKYNM